MEGILVNGRGQRFINEDTYNGRMGQAALYGEHGDVFLIIDEASYEPNWMGIQASWVCETPAELEAEIGLPAGSLEATLSIYNRHAAVGEDPVFHKAASLLHPLDGHLGAFDLRIGKIPYAVFTLGGLDTTVGGEVLDLAGRAIPGRAILRQAERRRASHRQVGRPAGPAPPGPASGPARDRAPPGRRPNRRGPARRARSRSREIHR